MALLSFLGEANRMVGNGGSRVGRKVFWGPGRSPGEIFGKSILGSFRALLRAETSLNQLRSTGTFFL